MEDSKADQTPGEDITLTADALKAMGHPLRWKILCTLGSSEMSVGEIVEKIGTNLPEQCLAAPRSAAQQEHCLIPARCQPDLLSRQK